MSTSVLRKAGLAFVVVALLAEPAVLAHAAPPPPSPLAVTFVAPTPADHAVVATDAVSVAFTYNRTPAETRIVRCRLEGPTPSTTACSPPTAASGGATSGVSYAGLASGRYTFTARGSTASGAYTGPALMAEWLDASGAVLGSGTMTPYLDQSTYVRHRTRFRLGSFGTGAPAPAASVTR